MKSRVFLLLTLSALISSLPSALAGEFKPLFDGSTFNGWTGDTNRSFHIQDHAIVGGSLDHPIPRNEFLRTTRSFTNFVLRLKFKLVGESANGGVQIRTQPIPNNNEVSGYQADMGNPNWWGCLYDESRRNRVLAQADAEAVKKVLHPQDWNEYRIRCDGKHIQLWLNGLKTVDYTETDPSIPESGIIAVQIHAGAPTQSWYKDIEIQELP